MKRAFGLIFIIMAFLSLSPRMCAARGLGRIESWLCFYGESFPGKAVPRYDLYVLSGENHPDLAPIKSLGKKAVGYASFGELNRSDAAFKGLEKKGILVDENENWPGAYRVDMRDKGWHDHVLNRLVPGILAQGFDGIFIDTIDTADYLENTKGMKGAIDGAANLVSEVRKKYPDILIVLNNGLFLLDGVGSSIDAIVVEDVFTLYDFKTKKYGLATNEWTENRLIPIKKFQESFHKPVLSLDYLKANDKRRIKIVSDRAKSQGLVPYIAGIELDSIFFHP